MVGTAVMTACLKDPVPVPAGRLYFSVDTLKFDTVFTSLGSTTLFFKVYNPAQVPVVVPLVVLGGGAGSPFRLNVDGVPGRRFENVRIEAKDSIYVFVEVTIDPTSALSPFVVVDSVLFVLEKATQAVYLQAYGQDAHYYENVALCNFTMTDDKPHVFLGLVVVDTACYLRVKEGAQLFFDLRAGIVVEGFLGVYGSVAEPVVFRGIRRESYWQEVPGQWQGVFVLRGASAHIENARIYNATIGAYADSAQLTIINTVIANSLGSGLVAVASTVYAENILLYSSGEHLLALYGGSSTFVHATIAGFQSVYLSRRKPAIFLANYYELTGGTQVPAPLQLTIINSILWGEKDTEVVANIKNSVPATINFSHSLLRNIPARVSCIECLTSDPLFVNDLAFDFRLQNSSPAINAGMPTGVAADLEGKPRSDGMPDLGCYER